MSGTILFEFCAENATHVAPALAAGARRIELCDNLSVGGTTPSAGVMAQVVRLAHGCGAEVRAMIRPRGGDFVYGEDELAAMEDDIAAAARLGVDGIVFGCLVPKDRDVHDRVLDRDLHRGLLPGAGYDAGYRLDASATARLTAAAAKAAGERGRDMGITFHMAFDALDPADQLDAIDTLAGLGIDHILTHGGPAGTSIEDNLPRIRGYVEHAAGRLAILPGGGVTFRNAQHVAATLGVHELHGTKIVDLGGCAASAS